MTVKSQEVQDLQDQVMDYRIHQSKACKAIEKQGQDLTNVKMQAEQAKQAAHTTTTQLKAARDELTTLHAELIRKDAEVPRLSNELDSKCKAAEVARCELPNTWHATPGHQHLWQCQAQSACHAAWAAAHHSMRVVLDVAWVAHQTVVPAVRMTCTIRM